ncbi:MAG: 50S ribosomal protein L11 methyltransferase [Flavobacteriales bacterium]|nr:50S ribosomal protein L11 methyltransferase [Flavobacteriales bacterium]
MDYQKITVTIQPRTPWVDVFIDELSELGCDSFEETKKGFNAYIPNHELNENLKNHLKSLVKNKNFQFDYTLEKIPSKNWNEIWEKSFEPIIVGDWCSILAPFHETKKTTNHTIIIEPKMSFGTGHHETTYMMVETMKSIDFQKKKVLDMGTGTGILAILAKKMNAEYVEAIDIDSEAVENCVENASRNHVEVVSKLGSKEHIKGKLFDAILANINRNILLEQMPLYGESLKPGGMLILSGFLTEDEQTVTAAAKKENIILSDKKNKENWLCLAFIKE